MNSKKSCAVIGAGIVGICCGISLLEKGFQVTLYDPESPASQTSYGNAGGFGFTDVMPIGTPGLWKRVPGWLLDPHGPLFIKPSHLPAMLPWLWRFHSASKPDEVRRLAQALSNLLMPSMQDTKEAVIKAKLQDLFVEDGSLTVYKSRQNARKDELEWQTKKSLGVDVRELSSMAEINEMEPALQNVRYGYYTSQWCNTSDPYMFAKRLADYFVANGGRINQQKVAELVLTHNKVNSIKCSDGELIRADAFVIAAGIWSKAFCKQLGDKVIIESERGYNTTLPNPSIQLNRQIIFGEEKFVITNIGNGLRIGGAAEYAGTQTAANYQRSDRLVDVARRYLPGLDDSGGQKWMGQRPSTPDSIPVISASKSVDNVYYAFGHGHYGLTMAATTGKLVAQLISHEPTTLDIAPYSINRFL